MEIRLRKSVKTDSRIRPSFYNALVATLLNAVIAWALYFTYTNDAPTMIILFSGLAGLIFLYFTYSFWNGLLRPNNFLIGFSSSSLILPIVRPINKPPTQKDWMVILHSNEIRSLYFSSDLEERTILDEDKQLPPSKVPFLYIELTRDIDEALKQAIKDASKLNGFIGTQVKIKNKNTLLFRLEGQATKRKKIIKLFKARLGSRFKS